MILGDVEECITTVEIDEETCEEIFKVKNKSSLDRFVSLRRLK